MLCVFADLKPNYLLLLCDQILLYISQVSCVKFSNILMLCVFADFAQNIIIKHILLNSLICIVSLLSWGGGGGT